MNRETLTHIFNKCYERFELKRLIKEELFKGVNAKIDKNKCYHSETNGQFVSKYSYEGQKDKLVLLGITESEFMHVVSLINTEYDRKYSNLDVIKHYTPMMIYYAENHGFNNYLFYGIKFNDGSENEWFI